MTVRKKRPVLYEVIRPEHHRNDPAQPPAGHRPPAAPPPTSIEKSPLHRPVPPRAAPPPSAAQSSPAVSEHDPSAPGRTFTISSQMLAVIAASAIMLICIVFVAGKQFGAKSSETPPAPFEFNGDEQSPDAMIPETTAPKTTTERPGVRATAEQPKENPPAAKPKESAPTPAPAPTVALQKGYTYIVVQHFNKSKRADAEAAAEFLRGQGVSTALLVGGDIRLVATEAFLIEQRDAAAAERERRRAGQWQQHIKELGRQYDKMLRDQNKPGYTFAECYPSLMR